MRAVEVWPETPRREGDLLEVGAAIRWPFRISRLRKPRRQRIWIRIPGDLAPDETAVADALLLSTVFGSMRLAVGLRFHGRPTQDLVKNLGRLEALWQERRPDKYRAGEIVCDGVVPGTPARGPDLLCFSGGLDSAYSLFRHTGPARPAGTPPLGAGLMLLGADIPVEEEAAFETAFASARRMTDARGVPLLRASTNLRIVKQNWSHSVTAALAGVTTLFRERFGRALVAVGFTPEEALRWWPQDATDLPLVSCRSFEVVGDGYECDRFEKLLAIEDWREAAESLRVCYRPGSWTRNCGACMKCQVMLLFVHAVHRRAIPCFGRAATLADVRRLLASTDPNAGLRLSQFVKHARALGLDDELVREAERYRECPPPS